MLHDGYIQRTLYKSESGNWRVRTIGIGNNRDDASAWVNWEQGPRVFKHVDKTIYNYLEKRSSVGKKLNEYVQ